MESCRRRPRTNDTRLNEPLEFCSRMFAKRVQHRTKPEGSTDCSGFSSGKILVGPLAFEFRIKGSLQKLYVVGSSCVSLCAVERLFMVFG